MFVQNFDTLEKNICEEKEVRENTNALIINMIKDEKIRLENLIKEETSARIAQKKKMTKLFKDICNRIVDYSSNE